MTEQFLKDVAEAIEVAKSQPRIYGTTDQTITQNARYEGMIEGFSELDQWYENRLEEFDED